MIDMFRPNLFYFNVGYRFDMDMWLESMITNKRISTCDKLWLFVDACVRFSILLFDINMILLIDNYKIIIRNINVWNINIDNTNRSLFLLEWI